MHNKIAKIALKALLYEVLTSNKPGLVDPLDSGSHSDMDIFSFLDSSLSLFDYFKEIYLFSYNNEEVKLKDLREIGMRAEEKMLEVTNGVNTQKGLIFSFGLIIAALGINDKNKIKDLKLLSDKIKELSKSLKDDFLKKAKSNGEKIYEKYTLKGARGQAIDGYIDIFNIYLPLLKESLKVYDKRKASMIILLKIMSELDDTNIINRGGLEALDFIKKKSKEILKQKDKSIFDNELINFNKILIDKKLSSGGSADILATTWFIYFIQKEYFQSPL